MSIIEYIKYMLGIRDPDPDWNPPSVAARRGDDD